MVGPAKRLGGRRIGQSERALCRWQSARRLCGRRRFGRRPERNVKDTLIEALRIRRGDLIFGVDVGAARERLEEIGWVASARVERHLPDTIRVAIRERIPVAVWQKKGKFLLVDAEGVVIGSEGFERFKNLKIVIGKDAPKHAQALIAMLERQPSLMARVKAAVRSAQSPLEPADGQRGRCPIAGKGPVCRLGSFGGV